MRAQVFGAGNCGYGDKGLGRRAARYKDSSPKRDSGWRLRQYQFFQKKDSASPQGKRKDSYHGTKTMGADYGGIFCMDGGADNIFQGGCIGNQG